MPSHKQICPARLAVGASAATLEALVGMDNSTRHGTGCGVIAVLRVWTGIAESFEEFQFAALTVCRFVGRRVSAAARLDLPESPPAGGTGTLGIPTDGSHCAGGLTIIGRTLAGTRVPDELWNRLRGLMLEGEDRLVAATARQWRRPQTDQGGHQDAMYRAPDVLHCLVSVHSLPKLAQVGARLA